jgi:predicted TIM-barrel fold metal-dependent hydrolase
MYTSQGYRPWDPRLPVLKHFYARCVTERISVMNHCTPDGAPTFDRKQYLDFQHPRDGRKAPPRALGALEYFNRNFVAPKAWENVLDKKVNGTRLYKLRLCLAHFGGNTRLGREWFMDILNLIREYPNVYADISSSFCRREFRDFFKAEVLKDKEAFDKKIRHRILFGSDWYLTLLDGRDYREYCETAKNFLDDMDTSLWIRFTQANPYNFYRLDEEIERIAGNIVDRRQKDKKVHITLPALTDREIDLIYKEAAYVKIANEYFVRHEES